MKIKIALDWTPNAIHAGLFLAYHKGWYHEEDLDVELISPEVDNYETTPIEKLFRKQVFLAIAPSEFVIKLHQNGYKKLVALAALLQGYPSAFGSLKKKNLSSLKGTLYAALDLPYEHAIVQSITQGSYTKVVPEKLSLYDMLYSGTADFVWLFKNIEYIEAKQMGLELNLVPPEEVGIPYGLCTLMVGHQEMLSQYPSLAKKFFQVTERAYRDVCINTKAATDYLCSVEAAFGKDKLLTVQTIEATIPYFVDEQKRWGYMSADRWQFFIDWLDEQGQLKKENFIEAPLFSNQFIETNT